MNLIKKTLVTIALLGFGLQGIAQIKAVTEKGEEVLLYDNGTWKSGNITPAFDTRLDTLSYTKSRAANFKVKSDINKSAVWIDPKKWSFKGKEKDDIAREYFFTLKNESAYAMMINEQIEIPLSTLIDIAVQNMKEAATVATLTREEYRLINNHLVKYMEVDATVRGINFVYFGYYYSNESGTTQLLGFTAKNLLEKHKKEILELLNGFDLQ